jgi:diketogulonate reductase-like aldo/keto reductase
VRAFCREHGTVYQGFSLLTANLEVLRDTFVRETAVKHNATIAQIVFSFALSLGMLPLTGTSDPEHMAEDLKSSDSLLSLDEVRIIESLEG